MFEKIYTSGVLVLVRQLQVRGAPLGSTCCLGQPAAVHKSQRETSPHQLVPPLTDLKQHLGYASSLRLGNTLGWVLKHKIFGFPCGSSSWGSRWLQREAGRSVQWRLVPGAGEAQDCSARGTVVAEHAFCALRDPTAVGQERGA